MAVDKTILVTYPDYLRTINEHMSDLLFCMQTNNMVLADQKLELAALEAQRLVVKIKSCQEFIRNGNAS